MARSTDVFMPGMRGFEPIRAHIAVASGRRTFRKENKYWLSCRKKDYAALAALVDLDEAAEITGASR